MLRGGATHKTEKFVQISCLPAAEVKRIEVMSRPVNDSPYFVIAYNQSLGYWKIQNGLFQTAEAASRYAKDLAFCWIFRTVVKLPQVGDGQMVGECGAAIPTIPCHAYDSAEELCKGCPGKPQ